MSSHLSDSRKGRGSSIAVGLFAPAVVWFLHLFIASVVAEWGVVCGLNQRRFLSISMVSWVIFVVTLVSIAATIYSLRRVADYDRHIQRTFDQSNPSETSEQFLGRVAIFSGLIFLVVICVQALPILFFIGSD